MTQRQAEACAKLAREILDGYATGEPGDIEGIWLEERALALGLLIEGGDGYILAPFLLRKRGPRKE